MMTLFLLGIVAFLENNSIPCYFKSITGVECPGCGYQRSFIMLLEGKFLDSFFMYPALIPSLLTGGFLIANFFLGVKNGYKILMYMAISTVAIIGVNYVLKLLHYIH